MQDLKKITIILLVLIILGQGAWAFHTATFGGIRDGLVLGVLAEQHLMDEILTARYGMEASTGSDLSLLGDNPLQLFGGIKLPLGTLGPRKLPLWFNAGIVLYSGNNSQAGIYASFILEQIMNNKPLFLEAGADLLSDHYYAVAQIGYRIIDDRSELLR